MDRIHSYTGSSGKCIELYDEANSFDIYFHKCDLGKITKIFKRLLDNEYEPPQPYRSDSSYNLDKVVLLTMDPTLKRDRLNGNWVEKRRLKVIYDTLVKLVEKEQFNDLRHLKACYRKDKKTLKERLLVANIATLNNIADKLKRRSECVR